MAETELHDLAAFEQLLQQPRVLVFSHSPTCPISAAARDQYEAFRRSHPDARTGFVDVIADRTVACNVAERAGIRRESPQAVLFEDGQRVWHAAHRAITASALAAAWAPRC